MKTRTCIHKRTATCLLLALVLAAGCESTDGGGMASSVYYGVGFYDPWYYGGYYNDPDIIVLPPDRDRPNASPRPEQPIARPPGGGGVSARPMPSIPSAPRGGGGGRR